MASPPKQSKLDADADVESSNGAQYNAPDSKHLDSDVQQGSDAPGDVLSGEGLDPVLTAKLSLLNDVRANP